MSSDKSRFHLMESEAVQHSAGRTKKDANKKPAGFSDAESTEEEEVVTKGQQREETSSESKMDPMALLGPTIRRRIHALKNLQLKVTNLDAAFYMEVHALEVKYMKLYYPFLNKRAEIITGRYEPNDDECQWESESEEQEEGIVDGIKKVQLAENEPEAMDSDIKGIPQFWLTIFKNVSLLSEMVQEHDEPILEHLEDIKVVMLEKEPMGFILEFYFAKNDYFTNTVLTKEYHMKCQPEPDHPFDFEGPEIVTCKGCEISWCKDKNVTVKVVRKKQKHKSRGSVRTIIKTVPTDSFFNFFDPPELPTNQTAVSDDIKNLLTTDFEIGHYLRERVVPFAVLLFTGEGLDEEEDFEEEEDEEEEASSEEESSAVEDEKKKTKEPLPKKRSCRAGGVRGVRHSSTTNDESNEDDVKEAATQGRKGAADAAAPKDDQTSPGKAIQTQPIECKQQ